jgi:thioredoxin reductase
MPKGMFLRSEPFASNLWDPKRRFTFERYCEEKGIAYQHFGKPVPIALFLEYAEWFRTNAVGDVRDVRARRIRRGSAGFVLELSDGSTVESRQVVLATGHMRFIHLPQELSGLPESHCEHSARVFDVQKYSGRDLTIIGAGQSGLETAALAHEAGARVRLLVRKSSVKFNPPSIKMGRKLLARIRKPEAGLGSGWRILAISELPHVFRALFSAEKRHRFVETSWGPSGAHWLRSRVEGQIEVLLEHRVVESTEKDGRVHLVVDCPEGRKAIVTDHVIAATGFRIDVDRLDYLDPELRQKIAREGGRAPLLSSSWETSVPGLFIVGIASAPSFGPVMRFMFGAKHVARLLARKSPARTKRPAELESAAVAPGEA